MCDEFIPKMWDKKNMEVPTRTPESMGKGRGKEKGHDEFRSE